MDWLFLLLMIVYVIFSYIMVIKFYADNSLIPTKNWFIKLTVYAAPFWLPVLLVIFMIFCAAAFIGFLIDVFRYYL